MNITRVVVMDHCPGTDTVYLYTDLPSPMPGVSDDRMTCMFYVEAGKGVE